MKNRFLLVLFNGEYGETVKYCGADELEAYRQYKRLSNHTKKIIKADVIQKRILDVDFIISYDNVEVIRQ